jgi:hypothetical protein
MTITKLVIAAALAGAAASAGATITYNATSGMNPAQPVTTIVTFDNSLLLPAGYDSLQALIPAPGNSGYAAAPPGVTTGFFSVGSTHGQPSSSSVTFSGLGVSYFGFYMGSPDSYNSVTLYTASGSLTLNGTQLAASYVPPLASDGNQAVGFYMNFFAGNADPITKVTFASTQDAFESDNHSYIAAVPEAETYVMLLAGLALTGAMARRRKLRG